MLNKSLVSAAWQGGLEGLGLQLCEEQLSLLPAQLSIKGSASCLTWPGVVRTPELLGEEPVFSGQAFSVIHLPKCPLSISGSNVC